MIVKVKRASSMWKTTSVKHSSLNSSHQLSFEECIIDTLILRFIRLYTIHSYESLALIIYVVVISFIYKYAVCSLTPIIIGVYFQLVSVHSNNDDVFIGSHSSYQVHGSDLCQHYPIHGGTPWCKELYQYEDCLWYWNGDDVVNDDDEEGESEEELEASYTHV